MTGKKIDDTRARKMWKDGASDRQIAEAHGMTRAAVAMWRKREGLEAKHPPYAVPRALPDLTEDQFRHAMRRKTLHQAALELGAHWTTLKRKAEREGWI